MSTHSSSSGRPTCSKAAPSLTTSRLLRSTVVYLRALGTPSIAVGRYVCSVLAAAASAAGNATAAASPSTGCETIRALAWSSASGFSRCAPQRPLHQTATGTARLETRSHDGAPNFQGVDECPASGTSEAVDELGRGLKAATVCSAVEAMLGLKSATTLPARRGARVQRWLQRTQTRLSLAGSALAAASGTSAARGDR